ncbi:MAG: cation diffusion facilitator family transporter [Syntrophomonadaceae bacterium]|nr:cation diffusion facilitator family transporter [Syntrophomonadaceae bacterium]
MTAANKEAAIKTARNTIIVNAVLSLFKLVAGVTAHSAAMISDALHSLADVFSTVIVIVGVNLAHKKSDKEHPYGHERFECVAAIILSAVLFVTGLGIGWSGVQKIIYNHGGYFVIPGSLALIAALVSIAVKESMYWYTYKAAKKGNSSALMADAWHHRSDALSSVGSFAGILGARMGFPLLDPLASVIICLFILKAVIGIFKDAIGKMTDRSCSDAVIEEMLEIIKAHEAVMAVDQIKTRIFGDKIYVDVEISADQSATLLEAHNIAQQVHDAMENNFPLIKHCMVHVNPVDVEQLRP